MDLVYALYRKHNTSAKIHPEFESLHDGETLCSVSSQNIVAFTTRTELDDVSGKTWGSHVYVADLNTPWFSHKILSSPAVVTALEWDLPGHKLLVADSSGTVSLWTLRDYILNDWQCLGSVSFPGEHIIGAAFFHNGKKIVIVPEKKDNYLYSEKFTHVRFAPSVRQFGGRSVEGCLVISTTGMVGALAVSKDGTSQSLLTTTESLGSTRQRITAVDICYGKNGQYLVAASSGSVNMPIQCFRVSVKRVEDKLTINSQALPSFFMLAHASSDNMYHTVSQVKFVVREDADTLVVAANGDSGALIEIWELQEKPLSIHKLFQPKVQPTEPFRTVVWQHQSQFTLTTTISCMTTLKMALMNTVPPPLYVIVVLSDSSIHCLSRDSLKQVGTAYMAVGWRDDVKHQKLTIDIASIDLTWLGGALVMADTQGQLYMYRLHPIGEAGQGVSAIYAATLLEYCLVTGLDWWDVLVALRPTMVDAVCDRVTEGFSRQPSTTQQYHYVSHLSLRAALYRLSPSGQSRAADLTALLMLHSVSTAFKTLLRPSDLSSHDKGPADSLQAVMSEAVTDIDAVLLHLEAKEFTVEPSTLQSLHQLIQWVADLALNLLARLPEQRKAMGYELVRDGKAVNSIRELLIIIRFWGLLRHSCLPVFISSAENVDVLGLLFKLLSRLVQNTEPDDALIDDCILLPNQVMIPPLNTATPIIAITSPALFYLSQPLKLEFGVEPDCLLYVPDLSPVEGAMATDQIVDTIRHIYLGHQPLVVKQCCRCGGKAQVQSCPRTAAIRAWDLRWARSCRCGGHWRIHKCS
ncbi:mediator of RNA polymerase II transcription subunit 16-like [Macrosteles quadrilineatus]|uniref:mediator of RNA polymerase II transcription subunit 16-like n=1 Tax=Macrosteles quadrilineatus TaxID=74068 RepID=UPI0023E2F184|nr:mediator of RNA polymerase II transcription subunit 16-like [Macrosteles quadrilineatus]XP_054284617.1 mediator of RNA polymerase II transcription subunit 16-like [Macrosteles quadrilineatus]